MAKAVKGAFKWVGGVIGGGISALFGVVGKPIIRALTPKAPTIDTAMALDFQANPDAGIPYVIGQTATAGTYIYATTGEKNNRNILFYTILSGGGPIDSFVGFTADKTPVVFDGPDTPESGPYRHIMWQRTQLGASPSAVLLPPNTLDAGVLAEWGADHKTSGYAAAWYVLGADAKAYSTGVPPPLWELRGVRVYDWRLDGTYPGGIGPQRLADPTTWTFSENPAVHAVNWCLGRFQNGKRVLGLGATLAQIDMKKATEWANVCDTNAWKVGGVLYSTNTKWQNLQAICQAGGGYPTPLGAKISFIFNAPRVSIATLTGADVDGEPQIVGTQLRRERFNRAVPRFRSRDHDWQIVPAVPLSVSDFITQDGGKQRTKAMEWPLVQDVNQATQLAAYAICNSREIGPINVPLIPVWMGLEPGDCITLNEPEFGLTSQKLIIVERTRSISTFERSIACVSETDSKHGFCLGQTGIAPPLPSLGAIDTLPTPPDASDWDVIQGYIAGPGGKLPAIIATGAVTDPSAIAIIIEYREVNATDPVTYGEWIPVERPVTATRIEIGGLKPGATYQVRVRYRYARNVENPDGNIDLGQLPVGGIEPGTLDGRPVSEVLDDLDTTKIATDEEVLRASIIRGETVIAIDQVTNTANGNKTFVTEMKSVDGAGVGKAVLSIDANGHIGGTVAMNDGSTFSFYVVADEFGVVGTDGIARKVVYVDTVAGKIKFEADVAIDGSLTINGTIITAGLALNAATIPLVTVGSSTINCDGTNKLIMSHTITLDYDATLFVNTILSSHFPSGDKNWTAELFIDGVSEFNCGGANGVSTMPMSGARFCAAGDILVEVRLNSHTSVNVTSRTLSSWALKR